MKWAKRDPRGRQRWAYRILSKESAKEQEGVRNNDIEGEDNGKQLTFEKAEHREDEVPSKQDTNDNDCRTRAVGELVSELSWREVGKTSRTFSKTCTNDSLA